MVPRRHPPETPKPSQHSNRLQTFPVQSQCPPPHGEWAPCSTCCDHEFPTQNAACADRILKITESSEMICIISPTKILTSLLSAPPPLSVYSRWLYFWFQCPFRYTWRAATQIWPVRRHRGTMTSWTVHTLKHTLRRTTSLDPRATQENICPSWQTLELRKKSSLKAAMDDHVLVAALGSACSDWSLFFLFDHLLCYMWFMWESEGVLNAIFKKIKWVCCWIL